MSSDTTAGTSLEDIVRLPLPGTAIPNRVRFVDGHTLCFLAPEGNSLIQALWSVDLATGARTKRIGAGVSSEEEISAEEKLRRERLRERVLGVTRYQHAAGGRTLLLPVGSEWWVERSADGPALGRSLKRLLTGGEREVTLSPDGTRAAFVRDDDIYIIDIETGREHPLTSGAKQLGVYRGLAEYVSQEEMKRHSGLWWSPDGRHIAYTEVDERHIPIWRIPHEGKPEPTWEDHRYPFAGKDNAHVRLFIAPSAGGAPVQVDWSIAGEVEYLAQVSWDPDKSLVLQVQDRRQKRLTLLRVDRDSGAASVMLVERTETFIELHDLYRPLSGHRFLWGSERSGYLHLYVVEPSGEARALTQGPWVVDEIAGVDEAAGLVWILGSEASPLERHLYEVPLSGGPMRKITQQPGMHSVVLDLARRRFVDTHDSRLSPPSVTLRSLEDGRELLSLHRCSDERASRLVPPELLALKTRTGEPMYARLYRPAGEGPFPTVVFVYGGPHAQRVTDAWEATVDMRAQHLRSRGLAVVWIDNRGSARRGAAWASALHLETGRVELEDQVDGVRQLAAQGIVDLDRVGIYGWSYGGYMALIALFRAPDLFKVGVSGAPVTHWDGYDTHYTERYMGLPSENPEGYRRSSALSSVSGLRGKLMIVHGMLDENVHFRHTARLVNALIAARKDYVLLCFPDERHGPRKPDDRLYMEERLVQFLLDALARRVGDSPPPG